MSKSPFKPRKARKVQYSDNPKTARNRQAEATKKGFEVAELKAKIAFRTNKSRHLTKLHKSEEWNSLSPQERWKRENAVVLPLEQKYKEKIRLLEKEWDQVMDSDVEDEQDKNHTDSDSELAEDGEYSDGDVDVQENEKDTDDTKYGDVSGDMDVDPLSEKEGDSDEWEDEDEWEDGDPFYGLGELHRRQGKIWRAKINQWERKAQKEAREETL
jgi:hypothetical protein